MTEKQYVNMTNYIRKNKFLEHVIINLSKYIPKFIIIIYIISSIYLIATKNQKAFNFLFIPFVNLVFVSIFRKIVNSKRPYDKFDYEPIGKYKKGKGQSFPSRHTSSATIIAIASFYLNPILGVIMSILVLIVGVTRIICGVHYPKDVIGGVIISITCWMILTI